MIRLDSTTESIMRKLAGGAMKRLVWLAVLVVIIVAAGVTLVARPPEAEWTSTSPEALEAFEAGNVAQTKIYLDEARQHFKRAYELDPVFIVAKWRYAGLLFESDPESAEELFKGLMTVDLEGLTARETFLINRWRARRQGLTSDADRMLDDYVAEHPNDPYGLSIKAGQVWRRGDLEDAERLYQHLLNLDPNWVTAYNALGYIAMARGRFSESEEYFKSYRFIAPDQANPHDSLGELFITLGRWSEAESSLERAIEIKTDFWSSYQHLVRMKTRAAEFDEARAIVERGLSDGMPEDLADRLICVVHFAELADRESWRQIVDEWGDGCSGDGPPGDVTVISHRAACLLGDWNLATEIEDRTAGDLLEAERLNDGDRWNFTQAVIHHLQGVRLALRGDLEMAQDRFHAVDRRLSYVPSRESLFKLQNRMVWAEAMLAAGQDAQAHQLLAGVRNVNPPMVADFECERFKILGLERR